MDECCEVCGGEGVVITCWDDICVGTGRCMHGDGEEICSVCEGEGGFPDEDEQYDDYAGGELGV